MGNNIGPRVADVSFRLSPYINTPNKGWRIGYLTPAGGTSIPSTLPQLGISANIPLDQSEFGIINTHLGLNAGKVIDKADDPEQWRLSAWDITAGIAEKFRLRTFNDHESGLYLSVGPECRFSRTKTEFEFAELERSTVLYVGGEARVGIDKGPFTGGLFASASSGWLASVRFQSYPLDYESAMKSVNSQGAGLRFGLEAGARL